MQPYLSSLLSVQAIPSLLAALFLVISLLMGMVVPAIRQPYQHVIKLLGSLMVVGLSLLANSAFVYAVAIFIIATLVTDLEFLEKLAAMVWNRKEYWKYLIERASQREVEEKREAEAQEAGSQPPAVRESEQPQPVQTRKDTWTAHGRQQLIAFAQRFEEQVLKAINNGTSPFEGAIVTPAVRVQSVQKNQPNAAKIVDAIAQRGEQHFVVEIKAYQRQPTKFDDVTNQVRALSDLYRAALAERGESPKITPVLVVPSNLQIETLWNGVVVLRFDQERDIFVDAEEARSFLDRVRL